jgi:DNA-binding response OmpR family regulator
VHTLIVDSQEAARSSMKAALEQAGHDVTAVSNGEEALDLLREFPFELVISELQLSGRIDGLRVLEAIRWRWPKTAFVIATEHASLESAIAAIKEGVDGFLLKPVQPAEILQAAQQALDRQQERCCTLAEVETLRWQELVLDLEKQQVTLDGRPVELTPNEFKLLHHLMQNPHRVLPPQELAQVVRETQKTDQDEARRIVRWYIHHLRRKVEPEPSSPRYIHNVYGVGYTFGGQQ